MSNKLIKICCTLMGMFGMVSVQAQYCAPTHAALCQPYIQQVEFANLNHLADDCGNSSGYSDYTHMVAELAVGQSYLLTVDLAGTVSSDFGAVWFDWNGDGFDATERIALVGSVIPGELSALVTVPAGAQLGTESRFRIRIEWLGPALDPCAAYSYGETEDYNFNVPDPELPLCAFNLAPNAITKCQNVVLTWSAPSSGAVPDGYEVYLGTGGTFEIIAGDTAVATSFFVPGLLDVDTDFNWYVVPFNEAGKAVGCETVPAIFSTHASPNPTVEVGDPRTICAGGSDSLIAEISGGNGDPENFQVYWGGSNQEALSDITNDTTVFSSEIPAVETFVFAVQDEVGCPSNIDSLEIEVFEVPDGSISGGGDFCLFDEVQIELDETGVVTVEWEISQDSINFVAVSGGNDGTLEISPSVGTAYIRANLEKNGCTFITNVEEVVVHALPAPPTIVGTGDPDPLAFCEGEGVELFILEYADGISWSSGEETTSIIADEAGAYTATYTDQYGCSASSDVNVDEIPAPAPPELSEEGPMIVCPGGVVQLTVINYSSGITWNTGSMQTQIAVGTDGNYYATYLAQTGCSASSEVVDIDILESLEAPVIAAPNGFEVCDNEEGILVVTNYITGVTWNDENATANDTLIPGVNGSFIATFTGVGGCTATSSPVDLDFIPSPEVPQISVTPENSWCQDSVLHLVVSNYPAAQWNDLDLTFGQGIDITSSGVYRAEITGTNGCVSAVEANIVFSPNPAIPEVELVGDYIVVTNGDAESYIWFKDGVIIPGEINDRIEPEEPGFYHAIGVNGNCYSSEGEALHYNPMGLAQVNANLDIKAYPNPTKDRLFLTGVSGNKEIQIYAMDGKLIQRLNWETDQIHIDVSGLAGGVYLVHVHSEVGSQSLRLMKQ